MAFLALFMVFALPTGAYAVYNRLNQRFHPEPITQEIANATPIKNENHVYDQKHEKNNVIQSTSYEPQKPAFQPMQLVSNQYDWSQVAACMDMGSRCQCYGDNAQPLVLPQDVCKSALRGWGGRPQQKPLEVVKTTEKPPSA